MRATLAVRVILSGCCAAVVGACALFSSFDDLEGSAADSATTDTTPIADAGTSDVVTFPDAGPPPVTGFSIAVLPTHVIEDPSDSVSIQVAISRAANFTDDVVVTVSDLPAGVSATSLVIPPSSSSGSFSLSMNADAGTTNADVALSVDGNNDAKTSSAKTPLTIRLGSLLLPLDGGTYVIPSYSTSITVKAWGAGGGAGGPTGNAGGAGGFASGTFAVVGGQNYYVDVGAGGLSNYGNIGSGGGGGGLSGIRKGSTYVLIAGGGGGAGYSQITGETGLNGGGGGGLSGQQGTKYSFRNADFTYTNMFGGAIADGAGGYAGSENPDASVMVFASGNPGVALKGGDVGINAYAIGGAVGGGAGGAVYVPANGMSYGGGGGGGGYFGGGSGADDNMTSSYTNWVSGGGGGSGFVDSSATASSLMGAVGANPPNTADVDYVAGVAAGGSSNGSGGPGRIVIRLAKP